MTARITATVSRLNRDAACAAERNRMRVMHLPSGDSIVLGTGAGLALLWCGGAAVWFGAFLLCASAVSLHVHLTVHRMVRELNPDRKASS